MRQGLSPLHGRRIPWREHFEQVYRDSGLWLIHEVGELLHAKRPVRYAERSAYFTVETKA